MRRDGEEGEPTTLEQVLDRIEEAAQEDERHPRHPIPSKEPPPV